MTTNVPLWFTRCYVDCRSRCRHVHGEHVHPHLYASLLVNTKQRNDVFNVIWTWFFWWKKKLPLSFPAPCLFNSRFVWIQQGSGLHVFRHELAAHARDLLPVVEHGQRQVFLGLLLQAWEIQQRNRKYKSRSQWASDICSGIQLFRCIYHFLCRLSSTNWNFNTAVSQVRSGLKRKSLIIVTGVHSWLKWP